MKNGFLRLARGPVLLLTLFPTPGCSQDMEWSAVRTMVRTSFPDVEQISSDSLATWMERDSSLVVLDVREPDEYAVSRIPGAIQIDPDATEIPTLDPGATVITYCSVGYRSSRLADRLRQQGVTVVNLEGSIFQWANEGRPLVNDSGYVTKVHAFDPTWGSLLRPELRTGIKQ